jgi:release factor glutamine methyltransferase
MTNSKTLFYDLRDNITLAESSDEIGSIIYLVLDHVAGLSQADILSEKKIELTAQMKKKLEGIIARLNVHEPVQYIIGETEFYGRKFSVNASVLIPRPETEELVRLVLTSLKHEAPRILDIGTGSGCIPITLTLELPNAVVSATDISEEAIAVATKNAKNLNASVNFFVHDILKDDLPFIDLDCIVSNPPYITEKEKVDMSQNVVDYEPHLALFVPDHDPLRFYAAIAHKSFRSLRQRGQLVVEINEQFGEQVAELFSKTGFEQVEIYKDLFGKDRMVKGLKSR